MKHLFIILLFLLSFNVRAEMLDVDYNFIDTAFDGIKPVTDKEFNDTINKLTPQPVENTFGGRLKAFLFGRKLGVETPNIKEPDEEIDFGGEKKAIEEIRNGIYFIKLIAPIVAQDGKIIPAGNYKIFEKNIYNQPMLVFYQGRDEYGMLQLKKFEDNLKGENDLTYSRVDIVSDDLIRIVYATIEDTKCAVAKVYLQN